MPFCRRRCAYCDFNAYVDPGQSFRWRYLHAVANDLRQNSQVEPLQTVFVGGGTPTILDAEQLAFLFASIKQNFALDPDCEVTVEANPGTIDEAKLSVLRSGGVNRLSLGVQSFCDSELETICRIHSAHQAHQAYELALAAGFDNISLDLIYGLPGQTLASFQDSVQQALALRPSHLSLYALSLEPGTRITRLVESGQLSLPDEDTLAAFEDLLPSLMAAAGMQQYEISNWCRPGSHCRHNLACWQGMDYLGVGCGAVSYLRSWRFRRLDNPWQYCQAMENDSEVVAWGERLSWDNALKEAIMMGMRTNQGIRMSQLVERYGVARQELVAMFSDLPEDLVQMVDGWVRLSARGRQVSNEVFMRLWECRLAHC